MKSRNQVGLHMFISDIKEFRGMEMDIKQGTEANSSLTTVTILCGVYLTTQ